MKATRRGFLQAAGAASLFSIAPARTRGSSRPRDRTCICLPVQEMQVQSLGQEDPLEEERAIHSAILA